MSQTEFDAGAAAVRRAQGDMRAFLEGLAVRLQGALPGQVAVERASDGLFSGRTHVARISVTLDQWVLDIALRHGHTQCRRAKSVRGVTLRTEEMALPAWLGALGAELRTLGEQSGAAHEALHDFLMG